MLGTRRAVAVFGGLLAGFALGAGAHSVIRGVEESSAALAGIGFGLGVGLMVAAMLRE